MKWINSRRFVICLICLVIILYATIAGGNYRVQIATSLVPVLMVFMGATTVEKASEKFTASRAPTRKQDV